MVIHSSNSLIKGEDYRGVGERTLIELAGHSNMATTQRYIDLSPAMLKAAVELVKFFFRFQDIAFQV